MNIFKYIQDWEYESERVIFAYNKSFLIMKVWLFEEQCQLDFLKYQI